MDDVTLAVQARVGWEFGGRVPKEVRPSVPVRTDLKIADPAQSTFFH
jgi:transcription initiation factor TFIID subunit 9B